MKNKLKSKNLLEVMVPYGTPLPGRLLARGGSSELGRGAGRQSLRTEVPMGRHAFLATLEKQVRLWAWPDYGSAPQNPRASVAGLRNRAGA